jgi:hypothetical protein
MLDVYCDPMAKGIANKAFSNATSALEIATVLLLHL